MTTLYLDDLTAGQRFTSAAHILDEGQIKAFATQFDPQYFHLDNEAAKDSLFGGLVASGWHVAAISMRLLVAILPIAGGIIGAGGEIQWPQPTRPGDTLTVTAEIISVTPSRSRPERGIVKMRMETRNQKDEAVQTSTMTLVVNKRPATSDENA